MARQRVSRQELNRRRRASGFVGRTGELNVFRDNLARDPHDDTFQYLFHVSGNAGVGKTTLVRQWEAAARARQAVTAYVDDGVHSVIEAMEAVSAQLEQQGAAFKGFQELLTTYRQRRHEAESAPGAAPGTADTADSGRPAAASPLSTVLAQAGLAGLGMVPGAGAVAGAMNPQQLAQTAGQLRAMVAARLRSHDDVQLVLSPLQALTPVFLEDLAKAAERRPWIVLFFDVFERTGPVLNEWLRDVLTAETYGTLPENVVAVLSGQGRLDARCWGDHQYLVHETPLDVFTEDEARGLLAAHGITGEPVVQIILQLTGRLPVLVDLLAQTRPEDPDDIGDPSDTAVDRFLRWITDPERRAAALSCALPLQLDEDVYRAAAPAGAAEEYPWLRGLPFVAGHGGRCRYHDVVRAPMLRLQRTQSPARWQRQHTHLARTFQGRREARQSALSPYEYWDDPDWREHRLNETYHLLCADPAHALPDALLTMVGACDSDTATLRRSAQTLVDAGHSADAPAVTAWGQRLRDAADDEATAVVTVLTLLLTAPELGTAGRALAHTIRGREHRQAARYDQALADYRRALELDPGLARAHYGRGETLRLTERYGDALASLGRAVELDPSDSESFGARAEVFEALGDREAAAADYDRAVELTPHNYWLVAGRAFNSYFMDRHDEALADFGHALELNPDYAWALAGRGEVYRFVDRYDEALADFDRSLELNPDSPWALASRGETYRLMNRYDEALADFDRALELSPAYAWVFSRRGSMHRSTARYDEALADFDRALELGPDSAWTIADRGETYRLMNRYDEALADFDRALELDPTHAWAVSNRGDTHVLLGRYDEALADFDRALELNPDYASALAGRGETRLRTGRYDEALADFDRARRLDPGEGLHHWGIALVMHRLARPEEAAAHWRTAAELLAAGIPGDPHAAVDALGNVMVTRCAMGEWDDATRLLDGFLAGGPTVWRIREALHDLAQFASLMALDPAPLEPVRRRLREAEAAAAQASVTA